MWRARNALTIVESECFVRFGAVAAEHPQSHCFGVPVNDLEGGYEYPDVVRFEIEEQDLPSYRRAAGFHQHHNVDVATQTSG